jgi:SulP family sulfate permease
MSTASTQFLPKLITVLREGYTVRRLGTDLVAGLTVAIVALPLSMGIAIASGVSPDRGLFTAIVAGFIVSAFGGSRFQIGGPTAAFIVVVYRIVERHGYDGLAIATLMAGVALLIAGALKLGTYVKYVPYPVTIGFSAGIGVTIFVSQIGDILGLSAGKLPGDFIPKVEALMSALPSVTPVAAVLAAVALGLILGLRAINPKWPGMLIAVIVTSVLVVTFHLGVVTIGSKFGAMPAGLPMPAVPALSWARLAAAGPDAVTIAILAGIESLLSAVVADGLTGSRHRSNGELVAQGLANIASPLFGGLPATGALARTATNIRAGSTGPVSGMAHAVFVLIVMMLAAPLMAYVPLACLAAILTIVAWNMSEAHVVVRLIRNCDTGDRLVLTGTFLLTIFFDLTVGILFGVIVSAFLFMHKMAGTVQLSGADGSGDTAEDALAAAATATGETAIFRISGPFFFGAAGEVAETLKRIGQSPKRLILDFAGVPIVDATGAAALKGIIDAARGRSTQVILTAMAPAVVQSLTQHGILAGRADVRSATSIRAALEP